MTPLSDAELLARLIAHRSVSHLSNAALADEICDYAERPGVSLERFADQTGEKINLMIHAGPVVEPGTRSGLVLSGHMDVVPANEAGWRSDPFVLTERDGALIGRGAADMKGFLALALNALAALDARALKRPLVLLLTCDEEIGTRGAERWVKAWPGDLHLPRAAIIGEPTELKVVRMHKGHAWLRLELRGKSAHSGYPHLGENAIALAGRALVAIDGVRRSMQGERNASSQHFDVPYTPLNVGQIDGGSAVNVVPDRCVLQLGFRPLPGTKTSTVVARIRQALGAAIYGFDDPERGHRLELLSDSPPLAVDEDAPIHQHLCSLLEQRQTHAVSYATDAGWLQQLELDCVIWGPGSIEAAHQPNESIAIAELARASSWLAQIVRYHCQENSP